MRSLRPVLILIAMMCAGAAHAQGGASSIDELLRERAQPEAGVNLDDQVIRPDGEPSAEDIEYENRVLRTFRAAQEDAGELDGRWDVILLSTGETLYRFQFADPGAGVSRIEGAWRNTSGSGLAASGYLEDVTRAGGDTVVSFREAAFGGGVTRATLREDSPDRWSGRIETPNGGAVSVLMVRSPGIETRALGR
jgi:hypothetical protein